LLKDLLGPVLKLLPAYTSQLLALLSGPKRFLAERDLATDGAMADALVFLGISLLVAFVAQLPLLTDQKDFLTAFAPQAVITFLSFVLSVAVVQLCWRLVGGGASFKSTFILSCYVSGVALLLLLVFNLAAQGSFRLLDPTVYRQLQRQELMDSFTGAGFLTFASLMGLGVIASNVWVFVAWGAYRRINAVSRAKSGLAFALANILGLVGLAITVSMVGVFQPVKENAADALPRRLVGLWIWKVQSETSREFTTYDFMATGFFAYYHFKANAIVQNHCVVSQSVTGSGHAKYDGTLLTLVPYELKQTDDDCTGKHAEKLLATDEEIYQARIEDQPAGWSLCLDGREGTTCFSAAKSLR
jgi:hypothetical protein